MPNIALIVAMRNEIPPMLKNTTGIFQIGDNAVSVAVSGVGLRKARRATRKVCTGSLGFLPDLLMNLGICGAVGKKLNIGHLIVANRLAYGDREIQLEKTLIEKVVNYLAESEYHVGKLQSFNWPVLSRARVAGDTLAVDMESFAIAQTAAEYRMPAIIIKSVSDLVPAHASLIGLLNLVRNLKMHSKKARARLSIYVKKIMEDQNLIG